MAHARSHTFEAYDDTMRTSAVLPMWRIRLTKILFWTLMPIAIMYAIPVGAGWISGGQIGIIGIKGSSMMSVIPEGSSVFVLPLTPEEGDYVVAFTGAPDNQSDMTLGDGGRSLVVKKYHGGRLVSTDDDNTYSTYEYRGRVIACISTQKVFWWRDTGLQNPYKGYMEPTAEDRNILENTKRIQSARDAWLGLNCSPYHASSAQIVGGHEVDGAVVADEDTMIVSFDFGRKVKIEEIEIQPPSEFWQFTSTPSIGENIPGTCGRFRPKGLQTQKLVLHITSCLGGPPGEPARINSLVVWTNKDAEKLVRL